MGNIFKKDVKDYKRLIGFVKPHLGVLVMAFLCMLVYSVLNGISPLALIPVIDNIVSGKKIVLNNTAYIPEFVVNLVDKINTIPAMQLMTIMLLSALVYFILRNIFNFLQTYLMCDVSQRVIRDVKDKLYKKLLSLSLGFYSKNPTPKLMSRITYDAAIIRDSISTGLLDLILRPLEVVTHVVVVIGVVLYTGIPVKFLLTSILLFPCILLPAIFVSKRLRAIVTKSQEKAGDIYSVLFEIMTGIRIVKAFSMQKYEYKKFENENKGFYKLEMKSIKRMNIISPINEITSAVYLVAVLYFAGSQIIDGTLSAGALFAFVTSVFLMIKPIKRLGKVYSVLQRALAAAVRIFEILDTEADIKDPEDGKVLQNISEKITFDNVNFQYLNSPVLKNINIEVKKGDIVALVGPSGAGKTTFVNLIPRFYDPVKGIVSIDDVDLKKVTLDSLRDQIGIVTQEMVLFNDTMFNNIAYGTSSRTKEEVIKAAKVANAHDFIMKLPEQYDTIIGEKGFRLSGGERQRVSIARAVCKNPAILIFDEATSQLDTEAERLVQEAIDRLMHGRTVFVIAHRLSTITHANKILVMDHGQIVEQGSHKELMYMGGLYKRLYEMQFSEIND